MAIVANKLVIEADPRRPVEEINNIISAFIGMWPGSEEMILEEVEKEIGNALERFREQKQQQPAKEEAETIVH